MSNSLPGTSVIAEDNLKMSVDSRRGGTNNFKTSLLLLPTLLCDQRYMEVCIVKEERPFDWRGILLSLVEQFEQSCSDVHWDPHDDTLRHTWNKNTVNIKTHYNKEWSSISTQRWSMSLPQTESFCPKYAASKRWSAVFSKEASMRTLSFILAKPNLVIPSISPWMDRKTDCTHLKWLLTLGRYISIWTGHTL